MNENENLDQTQVEDNATDYIEEIKNLRANSVSKDEYQKLKEENKKLIKTLAEGGSIEGQAEVVSRTPAEIKASMVKTMNKSNREFIKDVVDLYEADPNCIYVQNGEPISPDKIERYERTIEAWKDCLANSTTDAEFNEQFKKYE